MGVGVSGGCRTWVGMFQVGVDHGTVSLVGVDHGTVSQVGVDHGTRCQVGVGHGMRCHSWVLSRSAAVLTTCACMYSAGGFEPTVCVRVVGGC